MNNLNSLIIEGSVVRTSREKEVFYFTLKTERTYKVNDEVKTEVSCFDVMAYGKLADLCESRCEQGDNARVVGRLKQKGERVFILAEHVEVRKK